MLIQLRDNVGAIGETLKGFIEAQGSENRRLHARIDEANNSLINTNSSIATAVGSIKDSIAERSRITPSLVAMILSSVAILGGAGSAYIGLQTDPLRAAVASNAGEMVAEEQQRLAIKEALIAIQVQTAAEDARQKEAHRWGEKLLDELRLGNSK